MKRYIALLIIITFSAIAGAQSVDRIDNNAVSVEIGKNGAIFNLTYDHRFRDKPYGFRIGAGSSLTRYLTASVIGGGLYYLKGSTHNFFETGVDLAYLSVTESSDDQRTIHLFFPDYPVKTLYASANLGYRYYGSGFLFRAGFAPGFIKNSFIPGGYISFGVTF